MFECVWMPSGPDALQRDKGTSGTLFRIFDYPIHFASKTPSVIAWSSAERELYATGTRPGEALRLRPCVLETKLLGKHNMVMETDSSSGTIRPHSGLPKRLATFSFDTSTCRSSSRGGS